MCCTRLAGNTGRKKSPFWYHRIILSGYIFGTQACIDDRKNLLNSNISSTCPDNMVNFGLLTAEMRWRVWGTTANFNVFRVLAALLRGTLAVGVSQTAALNSQRAPHISGRAAMTLGTGEHFQFLVLYANFCSLPSFRAMVKVYVHSLSRLHSYYIVDLAFAHFFLSHLSSATCLIKLGTERVQACTR